MRMITITTIMTILLLSSLGRESWATSGIDKYMSSRWRSAPSIATVPVEPTSAMIVEGAMLNAIEPSAGGKTVYEFELCISPLCQGDKGNQAPCSTIEQAEAIAMHAIIKTCAME